jgi:hypothetical protein
MEKRTPTPLNIWLLLVERVVAAEAVFLVGQVAVAGAVPEATKQPL